MATNRETLRLIARESRNDPYAVVATGDEVLDILDALDNADPARVWAAAYEQGWRDRDEYASAESWPFVYDTANPHQEES